MLNEFHLIQRKTTTEQQQLPVQEREHGVRAELRDNHAEHGPAQQERAQAAHPHVAGGLHQEHLARHGHRLGQKHAGSDLHDY